MIIVMLRLDAYMMMSSLEIMMMPMVIDN